MTGAGIGLIVTAIITLPLTIPGFILYVCGHKCAGGRDQMRVPVDLGVALIAPPFTLAGYFWVVAGQEWDSLKMVCSSNTVPETEDAKQYSQDPVQSVIGNDDNAMELCRKNKQIVNGYELGVSRSDESDIGAQNLDSSLMENARNYKVTGKLRT